MLFLHEVHKVAGAKTDEFEEAFRKGLMPAMARATTRGCCGTPTTRWAAASPITW